MNESNKNNSLAKNIGPILLVLGLLVVLLSYFLVYKDYDEKTKNIKNEIKTLETRRNELRTLDAGKEEVQKKTEDAEKICDKVLQEFDGDVEHKQIIMDVYNITQDIIQKSGRELLVPKLELAQISEPYIFGAVPSDGSADATETIASGLNYTTKSINYTVTVYGTYEQLKDTLKEYIGFDGRRKVVNLIRVGYNTQYNLLKAEITVNEYAILGEERIFKMPDVPQYDMSVTDIFLEGEALTQ